MKKLVTFIIACVILASCQDTEAPLPEVTDVQVNTTQSMAKTAQVIIQTDHPTTLSLTYNELGKESESFIMRLNDRNTDLTHSFVLHNLIENSTYEFHVLHGESELYKGSFDTHSRPAAVNEFYSESENQVQTGLDGQLLLHRTGHPSVAILLDKHGQIAWYRTSTNNIKVANLSYRNTLLTIESSSDQPYSDGDIILETTLAGDTLLMLKLGQNDFTKIPHHDLFLNANNNIVFLTQEVQDNLNGDGILELDRQGNSVWEWSSFSEFEEPNAETYKQPWGNSIIEKDGFYYVSFRRLSQVWKINKDTKEVIWKLGENGSIQPSEDSKFLFQHFAHFVNDDELLLFDNGDQSTRHYSRVLSFDLSQPNNPTQKSNISLPAEYFSPYMGSVQLLKNDQFLVCSATNGVVLCMDRNSSIKWQIKANDRMYRCVFIEDLFRNED